MRSADNEEKLALGFAHDGAERILSVITTFAPSHEAAVEGLEAIFRDMRQALDDHYQARALN